jgi:IS4 transposase
MTEKRSARGCLDYPLEMRKNLILLTNHLEFGATTISAIYKDRWQIELFFKALKQNLKVKTFVGTTENKKSIFT